MSTSFKIANHLRHQVSHNKINYIMKKKTCLKILWNSVCYTIAFIKAKTTRRIFVPSSTWSINVFVFLFEGRNPAHFRGFIRLPDRRGPFRRKPPAACSDIDSRESPDSRDPGSGVFPRGGTRGRISEGMTCRDACTCPGR